MLSEGNVPKNIKSFLSHVYDRANNLSFGILGIFRFAIERFIKERGPEAAAGTAFFTIFSFFPLLLVLVFIGSFILESQQVRNQIIDLIGVAAPISPQLVTQNIEDVLENRGSIGIVALVGLAWSATGALTILSRNINRAWPSSKPRNFVESRALAFFMIAALVGLLTLSSLTTTIIRVLSGVSEPLLGVNIFTDLPLFTFLSNLVPLVIGLVLFTSLYRFVPNTHVPWKAALIAAALAAIVWQVLNNAFSFYLQFGLAQYQLIYGGLGGTVAFMFWIYLNFLIIIFGSYFSAALVHHNRTE
jgi:membrane protein